MYSTMIFEKIMMGILFSFLPPFFLPFFLWRFSGPLLCATNYGTCMVISSKPNRGVLYLLGTYMEETNWKFMMQCRYNSHTILHYRGKLISQVMQITAARVIYQYSLNWIPHYMSFNVLLFATKRKFKSICFKKLKCSITSFIKCPKGRCDSTKALTSASSLAGIPHPAAIAGLRTTHHITREEKHFFRNSDQSLQFSAIWIGSNTHQLLC